MRGAARARRPAPLRTLVEALHALPLESAAADRAAALSRELEERGEGLDRADCLVAGIALVAGEALLTGNRRHFASVPGLRLAPLPGGSADPEEEVRELTVEQVRRREG